MLSVGVESSKEEIVCGVRIEREIVKRVAEGWGSRWLGVVVGRTCRIVSKRTRHRESKYGGRDTQVSE